MSYKQFHYREYLIVAIAVIILLLFGKCNDVKEKSSLKEAFKVQADSVRYHKNKNGELIASIRAYDVTLEEAKSLNLFKDKKIRKLKNLVSHTEIKTITRDSIIASIDTIIMPDLTEKFNFEYKDNWINLKGNINSSVKLNYTIYDEFDVTATRRAPRFYKKKVLVVDVNSKNPHSVVTNIQSIQVKEPKKKFWETRGFAFGLGFVANSFVK